MARLAEIANARWLLALTALLAALATRAAEPGQVRISEVEVVVSPVGPVVLLKAENRAIPVFVDATVADSIHAALTKQKLPRPLSHDLMRSILAAYDGRVTQVVVTLQGATFHGALTVELAGSEKVFDSRSSDAIALAIHFQAPIFVSRELLESSAKPLAAPPGVRL